MTSRAGASPVLAFRVLAIAAILAGAIGLAYSELTVSDERTAVQAGPVGVTVRTDHHLPVPPWAGVAAIALGAGTLLATSRGSRA